MKTILTDALVEHNVSRDGLIEHARHMEEQRGELIEALQALASSVPGGFAADRMIAARREAEALLHKIVGPCTKK